MIDFAQVQQSEIGILINFFTFIALSHSKRCEKIPKTICIGERFQWINQKNSKTENRNEQSMERYTL